MDNFINMTIDEFLKLQEDIKKIKEYEQTIKEYDKMKANNDIKKLKEYHKNLSDRNIFYLFRENRSFFNDIATDIQYIRDDLYDTDHDDYEDDKD